MTYGLSLNSDPLLLCGLVGGSLRIVVRDTQSIEFVGFIGLENSDA